MRLFTADARFHLSGGEVSIGASLGVGEEASFRQTGGQLSFDASAGLDVGRNASLVFEGGTRSEMSLEIRGGNVRLSSGLLPLRSIYFPTNDPVVGTFVVDGGQLRFAGSLRSLNAPLDFRSGPWTVDVAAGIVDLYNASMPDVSAASLTTAVGSILVLPAGTNPAKFAAANSQGILHVAGAPLAIPAGADIRGVGDLHDLIVDSGSLSAASFFGQALNLLGGVKVLAGGLVDVNEGTITVGDNASGLFGGTLKGGKIKIGAAGQQAVFTHDSGSAAGSTFASMSLEIRIGETAGTSGLYDLRGGTVDVGVLSIGAAGVGEFHQRAGTVRSVSRSFPFISVGAGGKYVLDDGLLQASGFGVAGQFIQNGGITATPTPWRQL